MATTVEVLSEAFDEMGTPFIVGHPGGETVELMEAARNRQVRFILMKQETAGAMLLMLVLLAGVDFVWQKKQHRKKLRMTKKEVRDESKELQGDAQMKSRRQQFHRQLARQRIESEVPLADVVVTTGVHATTDFDREPIV